MKRNHGCVEVPSVVQPSIRTDPRPGSAHKVAVKRVAPPPGLALVKNSPAVDLTTTEIITRCLCRRPDHDSDVSMDHWTGSSALFLFFLGIDGKDNVVDHDLIHDNVLFVSSNIDTIDSFLGAARTSNRECYQIASFFGVVDPLGGGSYPLNYMVVVDSEFRLRCKMPIRMNPRVYGNHERFGVSFGELGAVVDQYVEYFLQQAGEMDE